jgi:hypothetical protein
MTIVHRHYNFNYTQLGEPKMVETDAQRQARTGLSSLEITDRESAAVQQTQNRVTLESMVAKIDSIDYMHPDHAPHMTIAVVYLENGYILVGKSVPADPDNFDAELGRKFAYEDAIRQMWPLEAYLMRERMSV